MKRWYELLPEPWDTNPTVLVVFARPGSKVLMLESASGHTLGVLEKGGKRTGLHVLHPQLTTPAEHEAIFARHQIEMAAPAWSGELDKIPNDLLMYSEDLPLLFHVTAMYKPFLQLRNYMTQLTCKEGNVPS